MKSGVYTITTPSGRVYVGSAINFSSRWSGHKSRLRNRTHDNRILQAAWDKYGDLLRFEKVIVCAPEQVLMYEQIAIDALKPAMNVLKVAGSSIGYRHTEETKAKFSARRGRSYTPEQIAAQAEKVRKPLSPENLAAHIARMAKRRGRSPSPDTIEKLRLANTGKKYGPMSEKHKRKISAANKGRKPSEAAIQATIAACRGKKQPADVVEKRLAFVRGSTWTAERRAKHAATIAAKKAMNARPDRLQLEAA